MRNTAAIANHIQAFILGFELFVHLNFHVVEFYFHTIEQGIIIGSAGGNFIQRIDHLDDAIQNALGEHKAQVAGCGIQSRREEGFIHALFCASAAANEIAETLHNHAAAQHVAEPCNAFTIAVGILEGLGEMLGYKQSKIGVFGLSGRIFIAVSVHSDNAVGVFIYHGAFGIHAECTNTVAIFLGAVDDLAFIKLIRQVREHIRRQFDTNAVVERYDTRIAMSTMSDFLLL